MFSPQLKGNIRIDNRGIAVCRGKCEIGTTQISNLESPITAFSFEFCSIQLNNDPHIRFGIKHGERILTEFDYFELLREIIGISVRPHIPSDGLGIKIHLLISDNEISLYINETLQNQTYPLECEIYSFYLSFDSISAIVLTPFAEADQIQQSFFPDLIPHLWSQLPFSISMRGFQIKSSTDLNRNVFNEEELLPLPGSSKMKYFEVVYRSISKPTDDSGSAIGLVEHPRASSNLPPGHAFHTIGFFIHEKSLYANKSNEFTANDEEEIKAGSVVGIGIMPSGRIFITLNGHRINHSPISCPVFKKYVPTITTNGMSDEVVLNLGQLPFSYPEIAPPFGWSLLSIPNDATFELGPPSESHLLHFYPFTSHSQHHIECFICSQQLKEPSRFEVTLLKKRKNDSISIGFSGGNFPIGEMVGWSPKTIGVLSDDGSYYYEDPNIATRVCDEHLITQGKTIGLTLKDRKITYNIDSCSFPVISNFANPTYPTITIEGAISIIVNFGEVPFCSDRNDNGTTKLFNGCRVNMTNEKLDDYGLEVGDEVECRDLSFRGSFVGELNGRLYFQINGIDGAVPLSTTDPVLVQKLIRVTCRQSKEPFFQPLIAYDSLIINNISYNESPTIYPTLYGISLLCGYGYKSVKESTPSQSTECNQNPNKFGLNCKLQPVMRPLCNLYNNVPSFIAEKDLTSILEIMNIVPMFRTPGLQFLDVVSDSKKRVLLMLGTKDGNEIGWNNKFFDLKGKPKILFRFFGFHLKSVHNHSPVIVNCGNQLGGQLFSPNYIGSCGSSFFQHPSMQKSFGAKGFSLIPPIAQYLITTLNYAFNSTSNEHEQSFGGDIDMNEIIYTTQTFIVDCYNPQNEASQHNADEQKQNSLNVNLITVTDFHYPH